LLVLLDVFQVSLLLSLHYYAVNFQLAKIVVQNVLLKAFSSLIQRAAIVLNGVSPLVSIHATCLAIEEGRSV
jgi:hypothetical protein